MAFTDQFTTPPRHYRRSHICANTQTHDLLHAAKLLRQS